MTLEEAIRHAEEKAKCGGKCGEDHAQLAMWLKELQKLKRTEERTETHACDLISREAAIDAFSNNGSNFVYGADVCKAIVSRIKQIPSAEPDTDEWCTDCAEYDTEHHCCPRWNRVIRETLEDAQPEIIRCKDCKYWGKRGLCDKWDNYISNGDFYCGCAERRTDE